MFENFILHTLGTSSPTLTHQTPTEDNYYEGLPLLVSCRVSDIPSDSSLFLMSVKVGWHSICCLRAGGKWIKSLNDVPDGIEYLPFVDADCDLPSQDNTMNIRFSITVGLQNQEISCYNGQTDTYSSSFLIIKQVKSKNVFLKLYWLEMLFENRLAE